jgi:ubiquinone/menaquinone biosynthesis C-methylase UbiE
MLDDLDDLDSIRTSYDTVAQSYSRLVIERPPFEDAAIELLVGRHDVVLDAGCGPGRLAGRLHDREVPVVGIDLSPQMIAIARREHPGPDFRVGSMTALDLDDASVGGVIAWWSIIHVPRDVVPVALRELHRVLKPGGLLVLGFHEGEGSTHKTSGYGGHEMDLWVHRWRRAELEDLAVQAGLKAQVTPQLPKDVLVLRRQ